MPRWKLSRTTRIAGGFQNIQNKKEVTNVTSFNR